MSFKTYSGGLEIAIDLANKAVLVESSLSTLPPLASPIPTLTRAFPLYIAAAQAYSHLLGSALVPLSERLAVKKKWRLVLERAEKVKARVEELGGQVGKADVGEVGEEQGVLRRGGVMNGVQMELWIEPSEREWKGLFRDGSQPELANEQKALQAEWAELSETAWDVGREKLERWVVRQGPVADCSVVAALGVCMDHNRRYASTFGQGALYPQASAGQPRYSENGRHILKLLLNGAWRSIVFDSLLPRSAIDHAPLHATSYNSNSSLVSESHPSASASKECLIGPPWLPLAIKGYYKALGGYSIRGGNPAPDIYAFTGWIPERLSLTEGLQREKVWRRVREAWERGEILITLGTGERASRRFVNLHAYAVLDVMDETDVGGDRQMKIIDPGMTKIHATTSSLGAAVGDLKLGADQEGAGTTIFTMTWDEVCSEFDALHLNWDPKVMPVTATRHWSWSKPTQASTDAGSNILGLGYYRLTVTCTIGNSAGETSEIWLLLSQHTTNKDRPLDDIALHVSEEHTANNTRTKSKAELLPKRAKALTPYTNGEHVLVRYQPRRKDTSLLVIPARDRGLHCTAFTLQALASSSSTLSLERISRSLPFSQLLHGVLTPRNAGGHAGWPSWISNPQYKLVVSSDPSSRRNGSVALNIVVTGDKDIAWNAKLLWGNGKLVTDLTQDVIIGDSGAYSFGLAYFEIPPIEPGIYTLAISVFEPGQMGPYSLSVASSHPVTVSAIPAEGAGMFSRFTRVTWTEETAGGRPSGGGYSRNPKVEVILPNSSAIMCRMLLTHPSPTPIPLNLTVFRRAPSASLGEQVATTGPYSDALSGVMMGRIKLDAGVYLFVASAWEAGMGKGLEWELRVWSDGAFSAAPCI